MSAVDLPDTEVSSFTVDQMKANFVSVAAHQLRTSLAATKWTLNMLLNGDLGSLNDEQRAFLSKAYESNARMIALLADILLSDQIDAGKLKSSGIAVNLPDLIDSVLVEIRLLGNMHHISIDFVQSGAAIPPVHIDPQQMRAVLQNLLENAVKYSNPHDMVQVSIEHRPDYVAIVVKDQGIGIPSEQQKDIFNRFFRASNAIQVEAEGFGLGLCIVKNIVEQNRGTISFTSTENEGSTFRVELPTSSVV